MAKPAESMSYASTSDNLCVSLGLSSPPVALAFADAASGSAIGMTAKAGPSACSFWRNAESDVFYAPAEAHFNCPVGAMVMGFELPKSVRDELMQLVGTMSKCGYIHADEPPQIPTNTGRAQGIIYGPLAKFPVEPYAVLCWLDPFQAMIWNEAGGGAAWGSDTKSTFFGRPACAALPRSSKSNMPVMSLGCIGMRTFTDISNERMLGVIPGSKLLDFSSALGAMRQTNDAMASFYHARKQGFNAVT